MRRIYIAGLLLGVACGGGIETDVRTRSGPTQFGGKHAVFFMYDAWVSSIAGDFSDAGFSSSGPVAITEFDLYIQDAPWTCWEPDAGPGPTDVAEAIWQMSRPKPAPFTGGDYALGGSPELGDSASAMYLDRRPGCLAQVAYTTGGKLNLSGLTQDEAVGSISVSLDDGTQLQGEFVARHCPMVFTPPPDGGFLDPLPHCGS